MGKVQVTVVNRSVDFSDPNGRDRIVVKLAALGLGHKAIAKAVGYTPNQVTYRCSGKKAAVSVRDYRNGEGLIGGSVVKNQAALPDEQVDTAVSKYLRGKSLHTSPKGRKKKS